MTSEESRYELVSRRRFIRLSAAGGLAAMIPGLACSNGSSVATAAPSSSSTSSTSTPLPAEGIESTTTITSDPADAAEAPAVADAGLVLGELVVDFSYVASSSGRVHSPYIAVWIEDVNGDLVRTVSLWFKSDERKYLRDLKRWNDADGQSDSAIISGATRLPGAYSVVWDATTTDGSPVPAGEYHVCIEASREDGPYELIREPITLDGTPFTMPLPDDGELTEASVTFVG